MKITFGFHLDGEHGWRAVNRLGMPILGPLGLLDLLETRLGLLRAERTRAQRVTQYRECLKRCDTPDRFYHASFLIDPIGVAASLLSWRDEWYLHGWNGKFPSGASLRTADMAAVEEVALKLLFPSLGERLVKVAETLSLRQSKIETVELVDPIEAFPKRWREVLEKLPVRSVRTYAPSADKQTVLGRVQIALNSAREGKRPNGKIPWSDDGSLRVVRAETRLVASRWLTWDLASHQNSVAIIAEKHRSLVDATLDAVDVPRQGFQESSSLVPALQVLPLALTTVWEPLDVYALLQFLSHPIGPMPRYARWRLAKTIAECPGIGGPRWRKAIQEIEKANTEQAGEIREALTFWIEHIQVQPSTRCSTGSGTRTNTKSYRLFHRRFVRSGPRRSCGQLNGLWTGDRGGGGTRGVDGARGILNYTRAARGADLSLHGPRRTEFRDGCAGRMRAIGIGRRCTNRGVRSGDLVANGSAIAAQSLPVVQKRARTAHRCRGGASSAR